MNEPITFGVYTAQFPFLEVDATKIRPVVVLSKPQGKNEVIAVVPLSSKLKKEAVDIALDAWKSAGLVKPSVARVHRLTTILQSDLLTELGRLSNDDVNVLKSAVRSFLNVQL